MKLKATTNWMSSHKIVNDYVSRKKAHTKKHEKPNFKSSKKHGPKSMLRHLLENTVSNLRASLNHILTVAIYFLDA
jgi:hypothetical protein